jgi:hypothetical protein
MPRNSQQKIGRCAACRHPEKWRLELLKASGCSLDSLAAKFGLSRDTIHLHWHKHVSAEAKASYLIGPSEMEGWATKAAREGDSVIDYLRMVRGTLVAQLAAANEAGDGLLATKVATALTKTLETMARVTGEVSSLAGSINITNNFALTAHPEYLKLQTVLMRALRAHPEALATFVGAMRTLEQDDAPAKLIDARPLEHAHG